MPELEPYKPNDDVEVFLWHYVPSRAAAGAVAACFGLLTLLVFGRMVRSRTWFSIPFVIGGIFEAIGYLARIWSAYNTGGLVPYSVQAIVILIAPALLAASIYMVLGRVIRSVQAEHHSIIRVTWLTKIFVVSDVLSFLIQAGGASLQTNQDINPDIGKTVVLVGLFIQVIAFGLFILAAILFHLRIRREPTTASLSPTSPWRRIIRMLYIVNSLILIRSVFRIIEYMMGIDSYLFTHEWPLFVFDGALMLLSMTAYAWWYPQKLFTTLEKDDATYHLPLHSGPSQSSGSAQVSRKPVSPMNDDAAYYHSDPSYQPMGYTQGPAH